MNNASTCKNCGHMVWKIKANGFTRKQWLHFETGSIHSRIKCNCGCIKTKPTKKEVACKITDEFLEIYVKAKLFDALVVIEK